MTKQPPQKSVPKKAALPKKARATTSSGAAVAKPGKKTLTEGKHYVGKAGHLAAMGEFAIRGYNVALPEVDKGDDIFVVNDTSGQLWRVQVKTSKEKRQKKNSSRYGFRARLSALTKPQTPDTSFLFVMRHGDGWRFCAIARAQLEKYRAEKHITTTKKDKHGGEHVQISIVLFEDGRAQLGKADMKSHLGDWETWPVL